MKHPLRILAALAILGVGFSALSPSLFATASTVSVVTPKRDGKSFGFTAAATKLLQGVLWSRNASGYIVNATDTASEIVVGVGYAEVDNSAGSAGDLTCVAERGVFKFANDSGTAVTEANVNSVCYVLDNVTVSGSGGTNDIIAGIVRKVDSDGVWVDVGARLDTATPADGSVTSAKIATGGVATADLADDAVTTVKILDDNVTTAKILDANVTTAKIVDDAITTAKLADALADQITVTTVAIANTGTPDGVAHVTGQVKDAQGNALTGRFVVTLWTATSGAWAAPADLGTLTALTNSTILKEDTDDAFARILTHSDGSWGAELDTASDGTVHVHATVGGAPAVTANAAITGN